MSTVECPACHASLSSASSICPKCGGASTLPIRSLGGKFQAVGAVLFAFALIATVSGAWWGPAFLFPGAVLFALGRFY